MSLVKEDDSAHFVFADLLILQFFIFQSVMYSLVSLIKNQ